MARKRDRYFALFGAILFLVTSSALTVAVIVTIIGNSKTKSAGATSTAASSTSATKESTVSDTKLAGTKLANFTPVSTIAQLEEQDSVVGTGAEVKAGDSITVDYTGAVAATGIIFQSSKDSGSPVELSLSQVIAGWSQGIPGMKVGGTRRLFIPASLAYGASPPSGSGIPANADLVFDVTVDKID